jgi:hypothetical protein
MNKPTRFASIALLLALGQGVTSSAHAHITMVGDILARNNDILSDTQKMMPCDGPRANGKTYTFQPGATIKLQVNEGIPHPSYYRIAFDNDGEDAFTDPASIDPIDPNRAAQGKKCIEGNADDKCGKSDFCSFVSSTGPTVLLDNLAPHIQTSGSPYTWYVKLPNVECENCTLQVIQVMQDTAHGAYCPQGSCANAKASLEDVYHRCINIKLKAGATNSPGVSTMPPTTSEPACTTPTSPGAGNTDAGTGNNQSDASVAGPQDAGGGTVTTDSAVSGSIPDAGFVADAGVSGAAGDASTVLSPSDGSPDDGCSVHTGRRDNNMLLSFVLGLGIVAIVRRRRNRAA